MCVHLIAVNNFTIDDGQMTRGGFRQMPVTNVFLCFSISQRFIILLNSGGITLFESPSRVEQSTKNSTSIELTSPFDVVCVCDTPFDTKLRFAATTEMLNCNPI